MMTVAKVLLSLLLVGVLAGNEDKVFFRSDSLTTITLSSTGQKFTMKDDEGQVVQVSLLKDQSGVAYWYRRVKTGVCETGECKLVDVGLYWDCTGDFFGIDVYGEHLTKTDHTVFGPSDYEKLISVLSNDWSILREYEFKELTTPDHRGQGQSVDATSGATRKEIASEAVTHAVYTTYTLWHLIHGGEKEQLARLTASLLQSGEWLEKLLAASDARYQYFVLELFGKSEIGLSSSLREVILSGAGQSSDLYLQELSIKAFRSRSASNEEFQNGIAEVYSRSPNDIKVRMLTSMQDVSRVHIPLARALANDLNLDNEWLALKILPLMLKAPKPDAETQRKLRSISGSGSPRLSDLAERVLNHFN